MLERGAPGTFVMRRPCGDGDPKRGCGWPDGVIREKNGQDVVFCAACSRYQYNAPRVETGRAIRSVTTVHNGIKPKQRARIILRACGACELCHACDRPLHAGHLLDVDDGLKAGLTESDLNCDDNLAAMCDECNIGLSNEPIPTRLFVALLLTHRRKAKAA